MSTETQPTAAELLAEWSQKSWTESKFSNHQDWRERRQALKVAIDQKVEKAGLSITPTGKLSTKWAANSITLAADGNFVSITSSLPATDLHALMGYLMGK